MSRRLSRRRLVLQGAGLAAGAAALSFARPSPARAAVAAADLVDAGESLRDGTMQGAAAVSRPAGMAVQATAPEGTFTSTVLKSPISFTHVGLHWAGEIPAPGACSLAVRTSADGSVWSAWRLVRVEALPHETRSGDYFGALLYAPGGRFVQYRAQLRAPGGATPRLQRVTATVIDSPPQPGGNQLRTVTVPDLETGRSLAVTPRELWLAEDRYRFNEQGQKIWNEMFVQVKKLVVHHTATRNDYEIIDEAAAEVRAIYYYHAVTLEWGDVGYNALVDKFGNLYEGRHGRGAGVSREMLSHGVVAGHALHHNYGSAGVALVGDATLPDWPMPEPAGPMWDTLVRYSIFESARASLRPLLPGGKSKGELVVAASDFLRSDDRWTDALRNVSGHRETFDTACPGDVVMAMLDDLRAAIHAGLAGTSRTGVIVAAKGREAAVDTSLAFTCEVEPPEEGWQQVAFEYSIEGWFRPPGSDDIDYLSGYTTGPQPRQEWTRLESAAPSFDATFTPVAPGHYTLHARAILQGGSGKDAVQRRSAYEGNHTYLVKPHESEKYSPPRFR